HRAARRGKIHERPRARPQAVCCLTKKAIMSTLQNFAGKESVMANTFHVAISVKDLPIAIERYTRMLGIEPAKVKPNYAKFELADPPAIISLNLGGEPCTVSHLGIRYADTDAVTTALARTKAEGMTVREQPGTTCCYAKADKFWVYDADGLGWEM